MSHIVKKGKKIQPIILSGYQTDFTLLIKYLLDTTNVEAGGPTYTHQTNDTDVLLDQPPTICMLRKLTNAVSGEDKFFLYMGTIVQKYSGSVDNKDGKLRGTFTFIPARVVDGLEPTTTPVYKPSATATDPNSDSAVLAVFNSTSSLSWNSNVGQLNSLRSGNVLTFRQVLQRGQDW